MCSLYSFVLLPPSPSCIRFPLQHIIDCPGLVHKLQHGPGLPKVSCPGLQVAEEAFGNAVVIVIDSGYQSTQ